MSVKSRFKKDQITKKIVSIWDKERRMKQAIDSYKKNIWDDLLLNDKDVRRDKIDVNQNLIEKSTSTIRNSDIKRFIKSFPSCGGRSSKTGRIVGFGLRKPYFRKKLVSFSFIKNFTSSLSFQGPSLKMSNRGYTGSIIQSSCNSRTLFGSIIGRCVGSVFYFSDLGLTSKYRGLYTQMTSGVRPLNEWGSFVKLCFLVTSNNFKISFSPFVWFFFFILIDSFAIILIPSGSLQIVRNSSIAYSYQRSYLTPFTDLLSSRSNGRGARLMLLRGRSSKVRGVAKNPCDHPNGGRTKGILRPMTPWSKPVLKSVKYPKKKENIIWKY